ncbi:AMIN domain-containing protein [Leptolyngbya sp. KIOST-1]|uniref:AMIN domain-containing protein n=1 Tax=Leptolyngbya sp. KIOST-1 TaxID=1229172 RepID=UPI0018CE02BA|nr:AMIN domain-containing protein [Leptolyngbya sp. KIOST-1]
MEHANQPFALTGPGAIAHRLGGWAGTGLMVSTLLVISPAARADTLAAWQFDPATQQLTLTLPSGITPQYTVEANPARIVLTLPQTQLGAIASSQTYSGAVSRVHLSPVDGATVIVLELADNAVLAAEGASLVAIAAGDQTRWVLTALATVPGATPLAAVPGSGANPAMIVELPVIPGNDPRLGFPAAGTGRLSTSAANLMLPSDVNSLANLPETLPVDPFNLGRPGEQVTVPSLAELDAAVGPVATAPQTASPAELEPPAAGAPVQPGGIATASVPASAASAAPVLTQEPPATPGTAPATPVAGAPVPAEAVATQPAEQPESQPLPTIDSETSGVPIAVTPPELPTPAQPAVQPEAIAADPPDAPSPEVSTPAVALTAEPPSLPDLATESAIAPQFTPSSSTPSSPTPSSPVISQEPPPVASVPVEVTGTDPNLLAVPAAPTTTSQGSVVPPDSSLVLAAAGEPILFGSPLPDSGDQAALPQVINPTPPGAPPLP